MRNIKPLIGAVGTPTPESMKHALEVAGFKMISMGNASIDEMQAPLIERADFYVSGRFVGRGFPGSPDGPVTIALLPEVVDHFRATGPGWQARIDEVLLEAVRRERAKAED